MPIVSTGLSDYVYHRSGVSSVFGIEAISNYAKFFDAVRRRLYRRQIREQVVSVTTVHRIIIGAPSPAIHGDHASFIRAVEQIIPQLRLHAGLQLQQLVDVALVQRQLGRITRIHHRA